MKRLRPWRAALPLAVLPLLLTPAASADTWPTFRGPEARGVSDCQNLPTTWDVAAGTNVRWKADVPGAGHSSPVVWNDRIFVTSAVTARMPTIVLGDAGSSDPVGDKGVHSWRLFCLSAKDGRVLWEKEAFSGAPRAKR